MTDDTEHRIPIIRLWDFLLVTLQGDVTDAQANALTDKVLLQIRRHGFRALVVDLSGLWLVDSHLCSVIAHLSTSAELMGARTVLAGLRPEVALTLLAMDVDLGDLHSALSLEQALEELGVRPPILEPTGYELPGYELPPPDAGAQTQESP